MAWIAWAVCCCGGAQSQSFSVASIKPGDPHRAVMPARFGPDSLTISGTMKTLIMQAYDVGYDQVSDGPDWAQSETYEIQAKADAPATGSELRAMLATLLAERFVLRLTRQTRAASGFALCADKTGPKLPAPRTDVPAESIGRIELGGGGIWAHGVTMKHLAQGLHAELDVPVTDETHMEGHYDFTLHFEEGNRELAGEPEEAPSPKISVFTALRQLGLRLEPRKLRIELLLIESAQRPAAN